MQLMDRLASYGKIGMFVIGLVSNTTLVIIVPYNLPMFTLVIYADTLGKSPPSARRPGWAAASGRRSRTG